MRVSEREGSPEWASGSKEPDLVPAIGELGNLEHDGTTLEMIGVHGPAHGVRLLATTTSPAGLAVDLLAHLGTHLVLQTLDDDESIRLLGRPDAADLGTGDLLRRLDGRLPVRVRGFRVSDDRLDELVRLMREAYGYQAPTIGATVAAPEEAEGAAHLAAEGENSTAAGERAPGEDQAASLSAPAPDPREPSRKVGPHGEDGQVIEPRRLAEQAPEGETVLQSFESFIDVAAGEERSNGHPGQSVAEPAASIESAERRRRRPRRKTRSRPTDTIRTLCRGMRW